MQDKCLLRRALCNPWRSITGVGLCSIFVSSPLRALSLLSFACAREETHLIVGDGDVGWLSGRGTHLALVRVGLQCAQRFEVPLQRACPE